MRISDWSSDVCSSDLGDEEIGIGHGNGLLRPAPIWLRPARVQPGPSGVADPAAPGEGGIKGFDSGEARRAQNRFVFRSEEHTSELQSLMSNSYAVLCLKKKTNTRTQVTHSDII